MSNIGQVPPMLRVEMPEGKEIYLVLPNVAAYVLDEENEEALVMPLAGGQIKLSGKAYLQIKEFLYNVPTYFSRIDEPNADGTGRPSGS